MEQASRLGRWLLDSLAQLVSMLASLGGTARWWTLRSRCVWLHGSHLVMVWYKALHVHTATQAELTSA